MGGGVTVWGRYYTSGPSHTNHICFSEKKHVFVFIQLNMRESYSNGGDDGVSMLLLMEHKTSSPSSSYAFSKEWKWSSVKSGWELLLRRRINKKMRSLIESTQPQYKGGVLHPSTKKNNMKCFVLEFLFLKCAVDYHKYIHAERRIGFNFGIVFAFLQ